MDDLVLLYMTNVSPPLSLPFLSPISVRQRIFTTYFLPLARFQISSEILLGSRRPSPDSYPFDLLLSQKSLTPLALTRLAALRTPIHPLQHFSTVRRLLWWAWLQPLACVRGAPSTPGALPLTTPQSQHSPETRQLKSQLHIFLP